jgi:hypothetical protein
LQLTSTTSSNSSEASSPIFLWEDNQSADLNRTFYEDQDRPNFFAGAIIVSTQNFNWARSDDYRHQITLEKFVKGAWKEELFGTPSFFYDYKVTIYIDPICGARIWCSGKYLYRIKYEDTVFKEFTLNFVPKKSNLKIKLSTDKEQAWGTIHTLKATVTPKVSVTCNVERDSEKIGVLKVKNGLGSMKYRALMKAKPASGRSEVNLYAVCKSTKYYGVSEVGFDLFVP